jgi:hypothetical protein
MKVERTDPDHVRLCFQVDEGMRLARLINAGAGRLPGACLELSSLLEEARCAARNRFRQPPHAFDEKAPRVPSTGR